MTRINLVLVEDLADQHLFAEWREIKMIPAKVRKLLSTYSLHEFENNIISTIPKEYTLSTGHVRFFYNKMFWLYDRYLLLTDELKKRNFKLTEHDGEEIFAKGLPHATRFGSAWEPNLKEIKINVDRISERLNEKPNWYRYFGEVRPPEFFIEKYNQQLLVDTLNNYQV